MVPSLRSSLFLGTCFVLVCGAVAGWMVGGVVPQELRERAAALCDQPFSDKGKWERDPHAVSEARRLDIPHEFADFDLQMDVELSEGAVLDVLMRRVEPRYIEEQFEQFHGRFSVLRLSADRGGEPWFSRQRILLGDRDAPGVELASGYSATVWVRARGRRLEANVAGRRLPSFLADDVYGGTLITVRGGAAALKNITITPRGFPRAWLWSRWTWLAFGVLAGALVRCVGLAFGLSVFGSGVGLVFAAWVALRTLATDVTSFWYPPPGTLLAMLGSASCCALVFAGRRRFLGELLVLGGALLWLAPPLGHDERELDLLFGPDAGPALANAHAQLVKVPGSYRGIHQIGDAPQCVFLLGGELVYGLDAPDRHLEVLLSGDVRVAVQRQVDVPCLPTVDGWSAQQWEMFDRFYRGFGPDVIVLGVSAAEGDVDPATGERRSWPSDLERTIAALREYCAGHEAGLVLFAGAGIAADYRGVLEAEAKRGTPLVFAGDLDRPEQSRALAEVIAPLLR